MSSWSSVSLPGEHGEVLRPPTRPHLDQAPEPGQGRDVGGGEGGGPGGGREPGVQDQGGGQPVGLAGVKLE